MKKTFAFLFLTAALLPGCGLGYLLKNGVHQADIIVSRRPVEEALKDPKVPEDQKKKLSLAKTTLGWAEKELGLNINGNYKTYVDLQRPYVTWAVIAAKKDRLQAHLWKYPFVGALPYRGYFVEEEALKESTRLAREENLDTYVRGVRAYSTLGWLKDPILSSMLSMSDHDFVNLLIHESVHATVFIKSEGPFNEQLATFIANKATEKFYLTQEGVRSKVLEDMKNENHDEAIFNEFVAREIKDLRAWYEKQTPPLNEEKRQARLQEISSRFKKTVVSKMKTEIFDGFSSAKLDNARLVSMETYVGGLEDFEKLYVKLGGDLKKVVDWAKEIEGKDAPQDLLKSSL